MLFITFCVMSATTMIMTDHGYSQTLDIRTLTLFKASQYMRSDRSIDAPRFFVQGLSLRGVDHSIPDTPGAKSRKLEVFLDMRYQYDLGLEKAYINDPLWSYALHDTTVGRFYLRWHPVQWSEIILGRHIRMDTLGIYDIDGMTLRFKSLGKKGVKTSFDMYAGRDVQRPYGLGAPARFDVQGLPIDSEISQISETIPLIAGAYYQLKFRKILNWNLAFRKRWRLKNTSPNTSQRHFETTTQQERLGSALNLKLTSWFNLNANISYAALARRIDLAQVSFKTGLPLSSFKTHLGFEHRYPWFDAQSIFNIFNYGPYQSVYGLLQYKFAPLLTTLRLKGWYKYFYGLEETQTLDTDYGAQAFGASLAHDTFWGKGKYFSQWSSSVSYQNSGGAFNDTQIMAQTQVFLPLYMISDTLRINTRLLALKLIRDQHHLNLSDTYALGALLGLDLNILERGYLNIFTEYRAHTHKPAGVQLYLSFRTEFSP